MSALTALIVRTIYSRCCNWGAIIFLKILTESTTYTMLQLSINFYHNARITKMKFNSMLVIFLGKNWSRDLNCRRWLQDADSKHSTFDELNSLNVVIKFVLCCLDDCLNLFILQWSIGKGIGVIHRIVAKPCFWPLMTKENIWFILRIHIIGLFMLLLLYELIKNKMCQNFYKHPA